MPRVLIAGGAGFNGSHLCERLLARGDDVVCIDNLVTGRRSNLASCQSAPGFAFIEHDVIEPLPLSGRFDRVYHLASPASPAGYGRRPIETLRVNSEGTRRLLELALASGARFLYASTSEIYGDPLQHPQRESYRGNVSSTGPRSMYDEGKRFGEALTTAFEASCGVDARIVRIFNTYGPRSDPADGRVVPNFVCRALHDEPLEVYGDGSQTRSLCYVDDLVDGLIAAMETDSAMSTVINLGNPDEHTILEYAQLVLRLTRSRSEITARPPVAGDDPQRRRPDITRAQTLRNWHPHTTLEDGLRATIADFREQLRVPAGAAR
jgi:nucleoside-diphosphate-sugar epimerase